MVDEANFSQSHQMGIKIVQAKIELALRAEWGKNKGGNGGNEDIFVMWLFSSMLPPNFVYWKQTWAEPKLKW